MGWLIVLSGCQSPAPEWDQSLVVGQEPALTPASELTAGPPESQSDDPIVEDGVPLGPLPLDEELSSTDLEDASSERVSAYLALTDRIGARAGADAEAMAELVTAEWYPTEERAFRGYRDSNIKTVGTTVFDNLSVQSARRTAAGLLEVAVFLCVDSQNVWVVDASTPEPPDDLVVWLAAGESRVEPTDERFAVWQEYLDLADPIAGFREPIVVWLLGESIENLRVDATENWSGVDPCPVNQ